jgi:hypothetical protein
MLFADVPEQKIALERDDLGLNRGRIPNRVKI